MSDTSNKTRGALIALVVLAGGAATYVGVDKLAAKDTADTTTTAPVEDRSVKPGERYYVFVQTVEVAPLNLEGAPWDMDASGPDLSYTIVSQNTTVFESPERADTLIARWSGTKIGLTEAINVLKDGKTDPGQVVDAALMRASERGTFTLRFVDGDVAGKDSVGEVIVSWSKLEHGLNLIKGMIPGRGLTLIELRVVPDSNDFFKVMRAFSGDDDS